MEDEIKQKKMLAKNKEAENKVEHDDKNNIDKTNNGDSAKKSDDKSDKEIENKEANESDDQSDKEIENKEAKESGDKNYVGNETNAIIASSKICEIVNDDKKPTSDIPESQSILEKEDYSSLYFDTFDDIAQKGNKNRNETFRCERIILEDYPKVNIFDRKNIIYVNQDLAYKKQRFTDTNERMQLETSYTVNETINTENDCRENEETVHYKVIASETEDNKSKDVKCIKKEIEQQVNSAKEDTKQKINTGTCTNIYTANTKKQNIDEMIKNNKKKTYKPIISSELEERLNKQREKIQNQEKTKMVRTKQTKNTNNVEINKQYNHTADVNSIKKLFFCSDQIIQRENFDKSLTSCAPKTTLEEVNAAPRTIDLTDVPRVPSCNVNKVDLSGKGKVNITILQYQSSFWDGRYQDTSEDDSTDKEQKRMLHIKRLEAKKKLEERKKFIKQHQRSVTLKKFPSTIDVRYIENKKSEEVKKSKFKTFIDKIFSKKT
ncbi:hypothetical protein BDAP_000373 [Binucleata daphniae]